ncbi:hypothetical protein BGZ65_000392, partial [Modicella reniformis]
MSNEKDKGPTGKDSLDLFDGTDELLDYGDDAYDLDADLLDDVENYGDLDFGTEEDDLALDADIPAKNTNNNNNNSNNNINNNNNDNNNNNNNNSSVGGGGGGGSGGGGDGSASASGGAGGAGGADGVGGA